MSATRGYERYGGLVQYHPLTRAEREYDEACRAIDYAQGQLTSKPIGLFTVG